VGFDWLQAKRLLTDPSPRAEAALRSILNGAVIPDN
jgi:hypothetical protein